MFAQFTTGPVALAIARWFDRRSKQWSRRARTNPLLALTLLVASTLPLEVSADALVDGVTVRIRSAAIEAGWHTGRIKRDGRSCSIVQLDRPTGRGHTLALAVVDALQLGQIGAWTAIDARRALASEPAHCLVDSAA
jgi:hypothetical protein